MHGHLGHAPLRQGRLDEAAVCYHRVLALNPRSADAYYCLGLVAHGQARWDEAIESFRLCRGDQIRLY